MLTNRFLAVLIIAERSSLFMYLAQIYALECNFVEICVAEPITGRGGYKLMYVVSLLRTWRQIFIKFSSNFYHKLNFHSYANSRAVEIADRIAGVIINNAHTSRRSFVCLSLTRFHYSFAVFASFLFIANKLRFLTRCTLFTRKCSSK